MINNKGMMLSTKNKTIIQKVIDKIHSKYPDIINLIGVTGSTHRGDNHDLSDLDLCIVVEDEFEDKFTSRFIIENICYDIYFTSWSRLENTAKFQTPYVTKLMEMTIVYDKDNFSKKYYELRKQLCEILDDDNNHEHIDIGKTLFNHAKARSAELMKSTTISDAKYYFNQMMNQLELSLFMLNKTYISTGLKDIPKIVRGFNALPEKFNYTYNSYYKKIEIVDIKDSATQVMIHFKDFIKTIESSFPSEVNSEQIALIYQELKTNWMHKLDVAIENNDLYSINMLYTFTQEIYSQIFDRYNCKRISLFDKIEVTNINEYSSIYRDSLDHLKYLVAEIETFIQEYQSLEQFIREY
jgi:predicted nucleotidyltransferase